jgi:hypothetical protein
MHTGIKDVIRKITYDTNFTDCDATQQRNRYCLLYHTK